jgi:hypothetical protein
MTPTCEKCNGRGERTDGGEWLCPRCGVWLNVAGDVVGPPISFEHAKANYERFVVDAAVRLMQEADVRALENPRCAHGEGYVFTPDAILCASCREQISTPAKDPE